MASQGDPMDLAQSGILQPTTQTTSAVVFAPSDDEDNEDDVPDIMETDVDETESADSQQDLEDNGNRVFTPVPYESTSDDENEERDPEGWTEIPRDTSYPNQAELKEMRRRPEPLATDHALFMDKLINAFEDPEYRVGKTGIIQFSIEKFNGTKESPNNQLLMRSEPVEIGGFMFQLKIFPRSANNVEFMGVFIECVSLTGPSSNKEESRYARRRSRGLKADSDVTTAIMTQAPTPPLNPVLPLRGSKIVNARPSIAANIIVVAYNPQEPTVMVQQSGTNRFSPRNPDWGWSRFHGPYHEFGIRQHCTRAPLLQDDKIEFTAFVRIIEDDTSCYHEMPSTSNPWDSFTMTGLHAIVSEKRSTQPSLVAAISTWMLLKAFREFLYGAPDFSPYDCRPMIMGLKKVLYQLRDVTAGATPRDQWDARHLPVSLVPIEFAFFWYGLDEIVAKSDVIELWEVMRTKLTEELRGTSWSDSLTILFGPQIDRTMEEPAYRVSIKNSVSVQTAIDQSTTFIPQDTDLPPILCVELERQVFNEKKREWTKLQTQISIDQYIQVDCRGYILYGIINHEGDLQSCSFRSVLRPNGPGTGWFRYMDVEDKRNFSNGSPTEKLVERITERQAIARHTNTETREQACVPYMIIYVHEDYADKFFKREEAYWAPTVFRESIQATPGEESIRTANDIGMKISVHNALRGEVKIQYHVQAVSSKSFDDWEGPGFIDLTSTCEKYVHNFYVPSSVTLEQLREEIAKFENVLHPVQIKVWAFHHLHGQFNRPYLSSKNHHDNKPFGDLDPSLSTRHGHVAVKCWYHVQEHTELRELLLQDEIRKKRLLPGRLASHMPVLTSIPPIGIVGGVPPPGHTGPEDTSVPRQSSIVTSRPSELTNLIRDGGLAPPLVNYNRSREDTDMADAHETPRGDSATHPPPGYPSNPSPRTHFIPPIALTGNPFGTFPPHPPSTSTVPRLHWANYQQSQPDQAEIYFFLKSWNPEVQTLSAVGTFIAKARDRIDHSVFKNLPGTKSRDHSRPIWTERTTTSVELIKRRRTFEDLRLEPGCIIIIRAEVKKRSEEDHALESFESGFLDLNQYLLFLARFDAFPGRRDVKNTYTLSYFRQEYYQGRLKCQEPTGEGTKIYFTGDKYIGQFQLGERHGTGTMIHINGDTYTGEFSRNERSGQGRLVEGETGNIYDGGWNAGNPWGKGITYWTSAQSAMSLCSVCWDEKKDHVLLNCGHVVGCLACSKRLVGSACPVCRQKVGGTLKLWMA